MKDYEIEFIIVDNNKNILNRVSEYVDEIIFKSEYEYKKYLFNDYNDEFYNIVNTHDSYKICIFDIVTEENNGICVAREICQKDEEIKVIFLSSHEDEYGSLVLRDPSIYIGFISKDEDIYKSLKRYIKKAINSFNKEELLEFNKGKNKYRIPINDITHLEVDKKEVTIYSTKRAPITITKPLKEFQKMLPLKFVQIHKSCIVNSEQVLTHNSKCVIFYNGSMTYLVSSKYIENLEKVLS